MLADERRTFTIRPRPPFRLDFCAWALRRRATNLVDRWDGTTYRRVVVIHGRPAEVAVRQLGSTNRPVLQVTVRGSRLAPAIRSPAKALLERMFGLPVDLTPFRSVAARDPRLRPLAERFQGLKPPRFPTVFEAICNGIACQQFTLTVGIEMLNRLARACAPAMRIGNVVHYAFPRPQDLVRMRVATLRHLGFSRQKAHALLSLSRALVAGALDLDAIKAMDNGAARERLLELDGVGRWTAEYALLRGLGRLDVFPGDDVGARKRLARWLNRRTSFDYEGVQAAVRRWHPYSGFAYFHLLLQGLLEAGELGTSWCADGVKAMR